MATIKFSGLVSDARGKIGGVVFQRNANGAFVRTLTKPIKSQSHYANYWKLNVAYYSRKWRDLTDAERKAWNDAKDQYPQTNRVGDTVFLTGFQLYQKILQNLEVAAYD